MVAIINDLSVLTCPGGIQYTNYCQWYSKTPWEIQLIIVCWENPVIILFAHLRFGLLFFTLQFQCVGVGVRPHPPNYEHLFTLLIISLCLLCLLGNQGIYLCIIPLMSLPLPHYTRICTCTHVQGHTHTHKHLHTLSRVDNGHEEYLIILQPLGIAYMY